MGNRCREGSLGKNNLPQSLNDHTCSRVVKAFRTDCLCVFDDISFCFFSIIAHCACLLFLYDSSDSSLLSYVTDIFIQLLLTFTPFDEKAEGKRSSHTYCICFAGPITLSRGHQHAESNFSQVCVLHKDW